jgi:hypothetical protein
LSSEAVTLRYQKNRVKNHFATTIDGFFQYQGAC